MSSNYDFSGRNILVTGAGSGIGRALCEDLYKARAQVYAVSQTQKKLDSLKAACPGVETVCVNLSDWDQTREKLEALPPMHGLVNNAGTSVLSSFLEAKPEEFDSVFACNVRAVLNVSQIVAKKMIDNKIKGSIVNMSSQASRAALQDHVVYSSSKGALDSMTANGALELGPHGIRTNCVNPTVVMTAMGREAWSDPAKGGPMLAKIPLGRFAELEDVVRPTMFLLSDDSAMLNGIILPVDGGFLAT
eukprot:TRINITY_DN2793_c0_g1_i7.p1 TRINITY_DN2793_c0_g1~~TRINITY_DN2793_c0_g1_i7.p1  ORF type:complete len:261 (-),score=50.57 TRINITY_DN2793_c0_g1_i7:22-762(-)